MCWFCVARKTAGHPRSRGTDPEPAVPAWAHGTDGVGPALLSPGGAPVRWLLMDGYVYDIRDDQDHQLWASHSRACHLPYDPRCSFSAPLPSRASERPGPGPGAARPRSGARRASSTRPAREPIRPRRGPLVAPMHRQRPTDDPFETVGIVPAHPMPYWGWG